MLNLNSLLILFLWIIPTIIGVYMNCYSNAGLILSSSTILYNNLTLKSCQCLMTQENISGYQYDSNENACYIFGNHSSQSDIRVKINSEVCFVNRTAMSYPETTTVIAPLPSAPVSTSTSLQSSNYFQKESISLRNTVPLTSLLIVFTVPKTSGLYNAGSYDNVCGGCVNAIINQTDTSVVFIFELINGKTIPTGNYEITGQFNLIGQARSTTNDTYLIRIQSYQDISGHF